MINAMKQHGPSCSRGGNQVIFLQELPRITHFVGSLWKEGRVCTSGPLTSPASLGRLHRALTATSSYPSTSQVMRSCVEAARSTSFSEQFLSSYAASLLKYLRVGRPCCYFPYSCSSSLGLISLWHPPRTLRLTLLYWLLCFLSLSVPTHFTLEMILRRAQASLLL